jgi:hypothetical protein
VAVAALDQAHVDAMPIWSGELRFLRGMAGVTEQRLLGLQQVVRLRGVMRRMASQAAHSILQVNRTAKIYILQTSLLTFQTATAGLLRREL